MEQEYRVIQLEKFKGALKIVKRSFRELQSGEVLVKIMCATIHPADLSFLNGTYGSSLPLLPLVPGFEGSGLIVKVGSEVNQSLVGKRCGVGGNSSAKKDCTYEGVWAEYCYTLPESLMVFDKEVDYETICFSMGNPVTAVGFLDTLRKSKATTVGQNGASSAFGKMFIRLCKKEGVKTVNLVRKEEHVESLKSLGADHVINTSNPNWESEFKQLASDLNITNFFECVGGDSTGSVLQLLPNEATMFHFGNLALRRLGQIDTSDFIFKKKVLRGWWLTAWLKSLTKEEFTEKRDYVIKEMESETNVFKTTVSKSFSLDEYENAFEYYLTNMSEGKVVIKPFN